MTDQPLDLSDLDWVATRFGRLCHIPRDREAGRQRSTLCGRFAFEYTDAPWCGYNGRACSVCVRIARSKLSPPSTTVNLSSRGGTR